MSSAIMFRNFIIAHIVNFCNSFPLNFFNKKEARFLPEKWTGELIGRMHNARVSYVDLANALGVSKAYISMVLNGTRKPSGMRERMETALDALIAEREREQ